jgi:hypothetical protein
MNQRNETESRVVANVEEIAWFAEVLAESQDTLEKIPPESRPSWYREYMAEESSK